MSWSRIVFLLLAVLSSAASGGTVFVEAESFVPSSAGWVVGNGPESRQASGTATLHGADGPGDATASQTVTLNEAGHYRVWVRFRVHPTLRGPFTLTLLSPDHKPATQTFDADPPDNAATGKAFRRNEYDWRMMEADLPAGETTLRLAKFENKRCSGPARHVDCVLLTTDAHLVPNHADYGTQTYLRVTFGDGYDKPLYLHVFADHLRGPWYQHFAIGRSGLTAGVSAKKSELLKSGERTEWCNITPLLYQDSGALLNVSARYGY